MLRLRLWAYCPSHVMVKHTLTSSTFSLLGIEREIKKYLPKLGKGNWHEMFSIPVLGKRNLKWVSTSYTLGSETGSIFFLPFNQEEKFEIKLHFKLGNFRNLYKCILSIFRKILFSFILNIKIWPKPSLSSKKNVFMVVTSSTKVGFAP